MNGQTNAWQNDGGAVSDRREVGVAGWMTKIILTTATTMRMAIWTRSRSFCIAAMRAFNLSRSEDLHYNILCR